MSHAVIASIYEAKLISWNSGRPQPLKIAFENEAYKPRVDETYLRAFTLPAGTASNTLGGDHKVFMGVFQISVIAPAGTGKMVVNPVIAGLEALFPLYARDTKGSLTVVIMTPAEPGPGITGDTTYTVPVSFQYRADTG